MTEMKAPALQLSFIFITIPKEAVIGKDTNDEETAQIVFFFLQLRERK